MKNHILSVHTRMKRLLIAFVLLCISMVCYPATSWGSTERLEELEEKFMHKNISTKEILELAVMYHELALQGHPEYINKGLRTFTELDKRTGIYARDPECIVRYGSLLCLKAMQYWFTPIRLWYLLNGILDMERGIMVAAGKTELSARLRLIRAETCLKIGSDDMVSLAMEELVMLSFYYKDDREKLARVYIDLAEAYSIKKNREKAELYLEKARKIAQDKEIKERTGNAFEER